VLIGGSVLADLRLVHPQIALLHARVTFDEMNATLEDLDSKTGCTKNGRRIPASKQEGILDDAPVVLGGVFRLASSWGEVDDGRPDGNPFTDSATRDRDEDLAAMSGAARAARAERLRAPSGGAAGLGRIAYGSGEPASSRLPASSRTLFMTGPAESETGKTLLHMPAAFPAGKGKALPSAALVPSQPPASTVTVPSALQLKAPAASGASSSALKPRPGARTLAAGGRQPNAVAAVAAPGLTPETGTGMGKETESTGGAPAVRETPSWSSPSLPPAPERGTHDLTSSIARSVAGAAASQDGLVPRLPDTVLAMPSAADLAASLPPSGWPSDSAEARTLLEVPSPFIVRTAIAPPLSAPPGSPSSPVSQTPSFDAVAPRSDNPRATRVGRVAWGSESAPSAESPAVLKAPAPAAPKQDDRDGARPPANPRSPAREDAPTRQDNDPREAAARLAPERAAAPAPAERGPADLSKLREKVQHLPRRQSRDRSRRGGSSRKQTLLLVAVFVATLASVLGVGAWVVLRSSEEPLPPEDTRPTSNTPATSASASSAPAASTPTGSAPSAGSPGSPVAPAERAPGSKPSAAAPPALPSQPAPTTERPTEP